MKPLIQTPSASVAIALPNLQIAGATHTQNLDGRQNIHFRKKLLKNSVTPIIITGDSIAKGLRRHMLLTWVSVAITLKMFYGQRRIFLCNIQHYLKLYTAA